ncbi:MAG TPA: hypothetical protein VIP77_14225 [Jiangellaceae bacterium]
MSRTVAVVGVGHGGSAVATALDSERDRAVSPDPAVVPMATVSEYKGADLFTGRFAELFGTA